MIDESAHATFAPSLAFAPGDETASGYKQKKSCDLISITRASLMVWRSCLNNEKNTVDKRRKAAHGRTVASKRRREYHSGTVENNAVVLMPKSYP